MTDGIYFNMDEATYHGLPRLSSSGIKQILISLPTFWAKSNMNPYHENLDDDSTARILGRAYHTAIFEPELMSDRFVRDVDPADFPDALMTDAAVKSQLKELGETQTKAGEGADERADRLIGAGYDGEIWSVIKARAEENRANRTAISPKYWDQIQTDLKRIADNPQVNSMITGGAAEVSVLWTCPESGIPMKARIDKLKADRILDLKSFANPQGKPVMQAILDQIKYNRYYIQARLYQVAVSMMRDLDLQIMDDDSKDDLVASIKDRHTPHDFWFFFQEKNGVPNLLCRQIMLQTYPDGVIDQSIGAEASLDKVRTIETVISRKADVEIGRAKQLYNQAMAAYGPDQIWYPFDTIGHITDDDFSIYWLDEMPR